MKQYITTISVRTFAESDEKATEKADQITKRLREEGVNSEIETIEEYRTYGLNNRHLDFHKILKQKKDRNINELETFE